MEKYKTTLLRLDNYIKIKKTYFYNKFKKGNTLLQIECLGEHKKYLVDKDLFALIYLYYLTTGWKM